MSNNEGIPTEKALKGLLDRLKAKDPQWDLRQEFGNMLMMQYEDFSPAELERYNHLKSILKTYHHEK